MRTYILAHLSDQALLRDLSTLVARDRTLTAVLLAHIAEADERRLYVPAGYSSMHAYCVGELRFSDDAAYNRITAARAARRFPAIFEAVADGRLHVTGVRLVAPFLATENAEALLAAVSNRSKTEIESLLAHRFGRPSPPRATFTSTSRFQAQRIVQTPVPVAATPQAELAPERVETGPLLVPERVAAAPPPEEQFRLHVTLGQSTHDKMRYAQALLGHAVPSGDFPQLIDRAFDALIQELEKRKFGAVKRPRANARSSARKRHIPAATRRAVWARDHGRCTFEGEGGHRCGTRRRLEFDHIDPVARGGQATPDRIRLRCRAHNQYEAERIFGAEFMREKRGASGTKNTSKSIAPSARSS